MSGFRYGSLDYWKRRAGLVPLPPFLHVVGELKYGDNEADFIDSRYYSPTILHWEKQALEFLASGGHLRQSDGELLVRIGYARRADKAPTTAQQRQFDQALKYRRVERRAGEALDREMRRRGVPYGPDYELEDDVKVPSGMELVFKELGPEWGLSPESLKRSFYQSWRKDYEAVFGMH